MQCWRINKCFIGTTSGRKLLRIATFSPIRRWSSPLSIRRWRSTFNQERIPYLINQTDEEDCFELQGKVGTGYRHSFVRSNSHKNTWIIERIAQFAWQTMKKANLPVDSLEHFVKDGMFNQLWRTGSRHYLEWGCLLRSSELWSEGIWNK